MTMLKQSQPCSVDGCERTTYARRLCGAHYQRMRNTGTTGPAKVQVKGRVGCSVDGCEGRHLSIGLCSKHHQRWRAHGDPTFVVDTRAEFVKNPAVHWRLRQDRGPATNYPCEHCGQPADHWAYDHSEAAPLQDEEGPYSLDQSRYMPLCCSCHTKFDKLARTLVSAR